MKLHTAAPSSSRATPTFEVALIDRLFSYQCGLSPAEWCKPLSALRCELT